LATRVVSRVGRLLGFELPLRSLFDHPTVEELAVSVEALLAGGEAAERTPLPAIPRSGPLPLSFAQERLWFFERLTPGAATYNMPLAIRLHGPLHRGALAASLDEVARRHETLRTTFGMADGEPVQVVAEPRPVALPLVDLTGLPASARAAESVLLAGREAQRPFDLARGPLFRVTLLALGERDHVVLTTMHHIVTDGWSMGVLVRELGAAYAALAQGLTPALPPLPVQYADYASWERTRLTGEVLEPQLAWWRQRLAGAPEVMNLPLDRPWPARRSFQGAHLPVRLGAGLSERLAALGRRHGATLFITLLAVFEVLLSRLTGQEDVIVGSPVANRNRPEVEGLIGFFVNFLALRGDLSGDPAFAGLLDRVRGETLAAYAHQELPFGRLVKELATERNLSFSPVFQVQLVLQNAGLESFELPGLTLAPVAAAAGTAKFELTLSLTETPQGLAGFWEYATDLFDAATVMRLSGHVEALLAAAVERPQSRLSELSSLGESERHQLAVAWNDAALAAGGERALHELFSAQAARTPEALAVVFGDRRLSYEELDRQSNQLARYLVGWGVGRGVLVGLFVERSVEMIVGILGVLKAGGAYLPLDPGYPMERLSFMLENSGVMVVLTQEALVESLPAFLGFPLPLDSSWEAIAGEAAGALNAVVEPEDLAYVIYTSGSTGQPKGVMVPHRGLANLSAAQVELFGLGVEDRVLQFAALSFDAAVWEIAMALRSGATLVLAPRLALLPGPDLVDLLQACGINAVTLPPSALAALPPESAEALAGLRTVIVAGEAFPLELARRWWPGRRLFNAYGPTEVSVCATAWLYRGEGRLPIGRPIANVEARVLDRQGALSAIGSPGELCVGGLGLARGYLGRPDLTAQRFVPHPQPAQGGERLYRTGDLVRWLADGTLEFLGRLDSQVKVRGFRIELGEIEAALLGQASVREAVVVARGEVAGERRLVAYVVPSEPSLDVGALREELLVKLPGYMVPASFVEL
ncbi:MAG TPA: amino acid adenylation domain-containing protein, partial [Thermoanaerobaculia bacterium]|nr:amino acid adenylation domain-containing protein [Thermoanaerobaculia bacterium]